MSGRCHAGERADVEADTDLTSGVINLDRAATMRGPGQVCPFHHLEDILGSHTSSHHGALELKPAQADSLLP